MALSKWTAVLLHLHKSEMLRLRLVRAGLLELLSDFLTANRNPVTVHKEDNISKIKKLSSTLCRPDGSYRCRPEFRWRH